MWDYSTKGVRVRLIEINIKKKRQFQLKLN